MNPNEQSTNLLIALGALVSADGWNTTVEVLLDGSAYLDAVDPKTGLAWRMNDEPAAVLRPGELMRFVPGNRALPGAHFTERDAAKLWQAIKSRFLPRAAMFYLDLKDAAERERTNDAARAATADEIVAASGGLLVRVGAFGFATEHPHPTLNVEGVVNRTGTVTFETCAVTPAALELLDHLATLAGKGKT